MFVSNMGSPFFFVMNYILRQGLFAMLELFTDFAPRRDLGIKLPISIEKRTKVFCSVFESQLVSKVS